MSVIPPAPQQGPLPVVDGGAAGYQHGERGSLFDTGDHAKLTVGNGYLKRVGDEGTLAIRLSNGSAFAIPNAHAEILGRAAYSDPERNEEFVRSYFVRLGIPAEQIGAVRTMTLLEAKGTSDEQKSAAPRIKAYYCVLERTVRGIPVPDSFAWARATADGKIAAEAVYWPALNANVIERVERMRAQVADPKQRDALQSRVAGALGAGSVEIRHSSAWVDSPFEAVASFDVVTRGEVPRRGSTDRAPKSLQSDVATAGQGMVVVRHLDAQGRVFLLPQERRNLGQQVHARKQKARP
jgi:hypothetical protein